MKPVRTNRCCTLMQRLERFLSLVSQACVGGLSDSVRFSVLASPGTEQILADLPFITFIPRRVIDRSTPDLRPPQASAVTPPRSPDSLAARPPVPPAGCPPRTVPWPRGFHGWPSRYGGSPPHCPVAAMAKPKTITASRGKGQAAQNSLATHKRLDSNHRTCSSATIRPASGGSRHPHL